MVGLGFLFFVIMVLTLWFSENRALQSLGIALAGTVTLVMLSYMGDQILLDNGVPPNGLDRESYEFLMPLVKYATAALTALFYGRAAYIYFNDSE